MKAVVFHASGNIIYGAILSGAISYKVPMIMDHEFMEIVKQTGEDVKPQKGIQLIKEA